MLEMSSKSEQTNQLLGAETIQDARLDFIVVRNAIIAVRQVGRFRNQSAARSNGPTARSSSIKGQWMP